MIWNEFTLDEIGEVNRGKSKHRPRDAAHLYGGPYPFIQTGDVKHSNLYVTTYSQTYSEEGLKQSKLWQKGTLCITIAANIADTAILGIDACFPDSVIGFIPNESKCDVKFIKYKFDLLQSQFKQFSQGAAQDNLSLGKLTSLKFALPPLPVQKKIAAILSAYDDLIENNLKRITLLDKSASLLYEEWFVRLRFPGYEQAKIIDGVPEGWEKKEIRECIDILSRGISPKYDEEAEGIVINQKCIRHNRIDITLARNQSKEYKPEKQVYIGDVLINSTGTGTLGRVAQVWQDYGKCTVDSHVTIVRPKVDISKSWFGYQLSILEPILENMGEGATNQKELGRDRIGDLKILMPTSSIQNSFEDVVGKIPSQINQLFNMNLKLKQARDILLPKLINGELTV